MNRAHSLGQGRPHPSITGAHRSSSSATWEPGADLPFSVFRPHPVMREEAELSLGTPLWLEDACPTLDCRAGTV